MCVCVHVCTAARAIFSVPSSNDRCVLTCVCVHVCVCKGGMWRCFFCVYCNFCLFPVRSRKKAALSSVQLLTTSHTLRHTRRPLLTTGAFFAPLPPFLHHIQVCAKNNNTHALAARVMAVKLEPSCEPFGCGGGSRSWLLYV